MPSVTYGSTPGVRSRATPKLCRHKATSQGYVTLNGKEFYLGTWPPDYRRAPASVRAAYDEVIARWMANGRRLPDQSPAPAVTVNDLILAFVKYARGHYTARNRAGQSVSEVRSIILACRVVRSAGFGPAAAADFGPRALKAVRAAMVDHGWSAHT